MERGLCTKQKIISESLRLFSQRGYDGVSMREIAAAVGIKGASIYNHFKGKEEIFNAIFEEMKTRYDTAAVSMNIPLEQNDDAVDMYIHIDETALLQMAENLFSFFCKDEFTVMFRKLLMNEQHKSSLAATILKQYYMEAPIQFQTQLFEGIQKRGGMKGHDAQIMAIHFYSPIYYVLCINDLGASYEECLEIIKKHVHEFHKVYA